MAVGIDRRRADCGHGHDGGVLGPRAGHGRQPATAASTRQDDDDDDGRQHEDSDSNSDHNGDAQTVAIFRACNRQESMPILEYS